MFCRYVYHMKISTIILDRAKNYDQCIECGQHLSIKLKMFQATHKYLFFVSNFFTCKHSSIGGTNTKSETEVMTINIEIIDYLSAMI